VARPRIDCRAAAADDEGLVSRVADVFTQHGLEVAEERHDLIRFRRPSFYIPLPIDGGEVRREGIQGLRRLRYDLPLLQELPLFLIYGIWLSTPIGGLLIWMGLPPFGYASALLGILLFYALRRGTRRKAADIFLRRAFKT
jgi:hypothetical protein